MWETGTSLFELELEAIKEKDAPRLKLNRQFNIPIPETSTKRPKIRLCAKCTATAGGLKKLEGVLQLLVERHALLARDNKIDGEQKIASAGIRRNGELVAETANHAACWPNGTVKSQRKTSCR